MINRAVIFFCPIFLFQSRNSFFLLFEFFFTRANWTSIRGHLCQRPSAEPYMCHTYGHMKLSVRVIAPPSYLSSRPLSSSLSCPKAASNVCLTESKLTSASVFELKFSFKNQFYFGWPYLSKTVLACSEAFCALAGLSNQKPVWVTQSWYTFEKYLVFKNSRFDMNHRIQLVNFQKIFGPGRIF